MVADNRYSHLVVPNLEGLAALCGAGEIVQNLPGFFDPDDYLACVACASALAGER